MLNELVDFVKRAVGAVAVSGPYPNGSEPYGDGTESPTLRLKRFACAAANHHPRSYTGSWCFGFGYVCSRCEMYADLWSKARMDITVKALGSNPDQNDVAAACGGGPKR